MPVPKQACYCARGGLLHSGGTRACVKVKGATGKALHVSTISCLKSAILRVFRREVGLQRDIC